MPSRDRLVLLAAILTAFLLDLPGMFCGIWVDEWASIVAGSRPWARCWATACAEPPPQGHYVLTWLVFQLLPPGEISVRLLSLAAHLLAVVAVHRYASAHHPRAVAHATAFAVAATPIMGWFATNGRPYALIVLIAVLTVEAYRARRWTAFAVGSAALGWLHTFALVLPVLLWLHALAQRRALPREETLAGLGAAALWAPTAPHLIEKVIANPLHPLKYEWCDVPTLFVTLKWWYGLDALPAAGALAGALALSCGVLASTRFHRFEAYLFVGGVFPILAIAMTVKPIFAPKLFLWTLPFAALCVSSALWHAGGRFAVGAWLAVVLAGGVAASGQEKTGEARAAQALARRLGSHDRVRLTPDSDGPAPWHLRRLPWTGAAAPRTWLLDKRPEQATADPDANFRILWVPGVGAAPPTTWPASEEMDRGRR